ncbi:unnamed protein product [Lactuca saligna]|uniref:Uncharacterized protein n=1 Tax=Lactuca saligna TaxID=75948 RepID=A0AA35YXA8_LACSI|nr:unnamed protein product [Lactuca saligna]
MAVESKVHHESSEEYDSEEYEDDEEVLDTEHMDVEMEEVYFKTQGKERCKDAFLNFSSDYEDNEADEDNDLVDEDEEGFGSEEEIDDTAGANDLDLGDAVGACFPIHDPSVKWNKMNPPFLVKGMNHHISCNNVSRIMLLSQGITLNLRSVTL